jgi:L-ascorbate metabolism protein UlaG (beta-lactamase superfamily)
MDPTLHRREFLGLGSAAAIAAGVRLGPLPRLTEPAAGLRAQRLSWAGIKLELGERTLLIDPWISPEIWEGAWTLPVIPIEVATKARSVLITHLHNDHFDPAAIRAALPEAGSVLCQAEIAATVASRGHRTTSLQVYEPIVLGDFTVIPVPAVDGLGERQVSWVVIGGGRRIIHCGDTVWHGAFHRIGRAYGPFDVAFLPINGAQVLAVKPNAGVPMSLTPDQAVGAAVALGAKLVCPIHYGLHDPKAYLEFPEAEAVFLRTAREREVAVRIVAPGDWLFR